MIDEDPDHVVVTKTDRATMRALNLDPDNRAHVEEFARQKARRLARERKERQAHA